MGRVSVTSPDGERWQVRRRWLDRPLPDLRRRFRQYREEAKDSDGSLDAFWVIDVADSLWVGIALAVVVILIVFLLLPLIGVALELILLLALLGSGIVGRVVLRRPWTVEAANLGDEMQSAAYAVKGWRRSGRAVDEIATAIQAAGPPAHIAEGIKVS
jgi:hypothetical protein